MLAVKKLHIFVDGGRIINGVSLRIKPGEIHVLMGPNGSGKSSLALALAGHPRYKITSGQIKLDNKDITRLTADRRAKLGLFLAMQHPVAVPGVSIPTFLRASLAGLKKKIAQDKFINELKSKIKDLKISESVVNRGVNEGFSGGEKKKSEVLQLSILAPRYAILDEIDSGLDIDALKIVAEQIKRIAGPDIGILLITHYQRILKHIKPDFVHVMIEGKIVKSGDYKLAEEIEKGGYTLISNANPKNLN